MLRPGDTLRKTLTIRREVPTDGWASCDTHVHTLTYSGHGDSTADERMVTLAGEGIELPIATEHNRQIDYRAAAVKQGVADYFTPVVGNEVTTDVGHFNIFPVRAGTSVPDFQGKDWKAIFASIAAKTGPKVIVLNHPRDLHGGFRPFGPEHHVAVTGENLDGWDLRANAVEVVNSGAQQTDVMRPFHDWFGLLNRGMVIAPVGASDSHDVSRFIVGQGRTYVRCKNDRPGHIDVDEAARSFAEGRVLVSCGLLAEITVNGKYGPGDLAPAAAEVKVAVRVLGPGWTTADKVELYANGHKVREERIKDGRQRRGEVGGRMDAAALPARHLAGRGRLRPGRHRAVLADREAVPADLARRQSARPRRDRRGVARRRRRRQADQRPRLRRAAGEGGGRRLAESRRRPGRLRRGGGDSGRRLAPRTRRVAYRRRGEGSRAEGRRRGSSKDSRPMPRRGARVRSPGVTGRSFRLPLSTLCALCALCALCVLRGSTFRWCPPNVAEPLGLFYNAQQTFFLAEIVWQHYGDSTNGSTPRSESRTQPVGAARRVAAPGRLVRGAASEKGDPSAVGRVRKVMTPSPICTS